MQTAILVSRSYSHDGRRFVELRLAGNPRPEVYELDAETRVETSGCGETLLYSGAGGYGQHLDTALRLGWCRLAAERLTEESVG